jgi:hypothetical protein
VGCFKQVFLFALAGRWVGSGSINSECRFVDPDPQKKIKRILNTARDTPGINYRVTLFTSFVFSIQYYSILCFLCLSVLISYIAPVIWVAHPSYTCLCPLPILSCLPVVLTSNTDGGDASYRKVLSCHSKFVCPQFIFIKI